MKTDQKLTQFASLSNVELKRPDQDNPGKETEIKQVEKNLEEDLPRMSQEINMLDDIKIDRKTAKTANFYFFEEPQRDDNVFDRLASFIANLIKRLDKFLFSRIFNRFFEHNTLIVKTPEVEEEEDQEEYIRGILTGKKTKKKAPVKKTKTLIKQG